MAGKILVADDSRSITEVLRISFDLLGYEVLVANDGDQAERLVASDRPDLCILDISMPGKSGLQLCREIKGNPETAGIPVILLTAKTQREDISWGYESGADAYVCKPYNPKQIEELVARLLESAQETAGLSYWSGLPDAGTIEREHRERLERGSPDLLLEASFEGRPSEVFQQKYGQARYRDFLVAAGQALRDISRSLSATSPVGMRPNGTFLVILPPALVTVFQERAEDALRALAARFYDADDRWRGHLITRDPLTRKDEEIPLISVSWISS